MPCSPLDGQHIGGDDTDLHVVRKGKLVPQSSIMKVNTVSLDRGQSFQLEQWKRHLSQVVLSQISHITQGRHTRGSFHHIIHENIAGDSESENLAMERINFEKRLIVLRKLLEDIISLAKKEGGSKKLSLISNGETLGVYERRAMNSCLPPKWTAKFGSPSSPVVESTFRAHERSGAFNTYHSSQRTANPVFDSPAMKSTSWRRMSPL